MNYRALGNTGILVSEIALGCEGFNEKDEAFTAEMFALCKSHGVNFLDLYSPDPDMRERIGRAINGMRRDFIIQGHLCTVWKDGQYSATRDMDEVKASFEDLLIRLQTDYIDVGMIHYVDSVALWRKIAEKGGILDYAEDLMAEGKIRHIGLSSHNPEVATLAVESGRVEVLMFSINPCYDLLPADEEVEKLFMEETYSGNLLNIEPAREKLYALCESRGVGITVMKAFGGGELLTDKSPAGRALTPVQCIHYALTRPAVAAVMSGVHTVDQLMASIDYENATEAERDYAQALAEFPRMNWQGSCMYCGHCAPCPVHIDIAMVTKLLNLARAQGTLPETVREHYAVLTAHASDCLECGACEKRCPFGVTVRDNMRAANELFGR